ncbi:Cytochrome P450 [Dillenia turbinata]|uniref:Cytochrome P450 n=1 Tax=Dillenia turbinata TaxID=194707 RepID=A0AAN8V7E4_9MAGN
MRIFLVLTLLHSTSLGLNVSAQHFTRATNKLSTKFFRHCFVNAENWFICSFSPAVSLSFVLPMSSLFVKGLFLAICVVLALLGLLIFLVLVFFIKYFLYYIKELMSKDQQPPVAGMMLNQLVHFNKLFDYQTSLSRKYRTYRLITPSHSEVYTTDPTNVEYILKVNFPNYVKGEYNYEVMRDLFGEGIFAVDGDKWRHQRKLASYEFSTKVLRDFSTSVFRANAAILVSKISEVASAKQTLNLQDMLMKTTLDSMFKVGFGVDLNTLSGSSEFGNRFTKAFDDSNFIVFWRFVDVFWKVKRFLNIGLEASLKRNIKVIDSFIFELIKIKREQMKIEIFDKGKYDILSRFLLESEKDPENMTDQYLRDITLNFLIAGKDTSANTLTWLFYMLCKHPLVQEKVAQEIREATRAEDNISAVELSAKITEDALEKMQYLHAALTETLRLYPVVPVDGKNAEQDDVLPDGFKIRRGDGVNYVVYSMGRMTYIWGEDAEEFRPERWINNGVFQPESPFKFTAFQAGPRICLGKEFAYRQMKILAAALLFFFKFRLADEKKEAAYRTMFTLHIDNGLHLFAFPRM